MNPLLLKPTTEYSSQLIIHGRVVETAVARHADRDFLQEQVRLSFSRLSQAYELLVLEGAGGAARMSGQATGSWRPTMCASSAAGAALPPRAQTRRPVLVLTKRLLLLVRFPIRALGGEVLQTHGPAVVE